jgi:hypothetical protein
MSVPGAVVPNLWYRTRPGRFGSNVVPDPGSTDFHPESDPTSVYYRTSDIGQHLGTCMSKGRVRLNTNQTLNQKLRPTVA